MLLKINSDHLWLNAPVETLTNKWYETISSNRRRSASKRNPRPQTLLLDNHDDDDDKNNNDDVIGSDRDEDDGMRLSELGSWLEEKSTSNDDSLAEDNSAKKPADGVDDNNSVNNAHPKK